MTARRALVTGVGGQDGYYLARLLRGRGYDVTGVGKPGSLVAERGDELRAMRVRIAEVDLLDREAVRRSIAEIEPEEVYNLAGHSFVPSSWEDPTVAVRNTSWTTIHLLEAIRSVRPTARFYQASTSEIFGLSEHSPQDEDTPVAPANPYAAAKVHAHHMVQLYRRHYGLFAVSGILYNHESPRRPPTFVTRKVTDAARRIESGEQSELILGDLDVIRDWVSPATTSSRCGACFRSTSRETSSSVREFHTPCATCVVSPSVS